MSVRVTICEAHLAGQIVRIHHAIDEGHVDGFVAAVGLKCFVLEIFDETIRLNGFSCLRFSDVSKCECPAPHHEFLRRVLDLRGLRRSKAPPLNLATLTEAMRSAKEQELFVSINVQYDDDDDDDAEADLSNVCYVGRIIAVGRGTVTMHYIDPDAIWDDKPFKVDSGEIYRLDVGGGYEEALLLASKTRDELTSTS